MERLAVGICIALAALALGSCSQAGAFVAVAQGNHAFVQGDYQEANIHYLRARALGGEPHWVAYNLGTLYHALGEPEVAEAEWNIAAETDSPELLARVAYNYGVHLFESGRFDEAYRSFRTALELDPEDVDTKINLEYTLQKLESQNESPREMVSPDAEAGETGQEVQMILEYVRRKEEGRWQSTETIDEDFGVQDW